MVGAITLAVEGRADEAVGKRLLAEAGIATAAVYGLKGKHYLDGKLRGYNNAAQYSSWIVLRDLNSDEPCAPGLRMRLLPSPAPLMPVPGSTATVGPGYTAMITEFATGRWRPDVAATRSASLKRLLGHLASLKRVR